MEEDPILTKEHMEQVRDKILSRHPEIKEKLTSIHDADFGYISDEDGVSYRVNGHYTLENLGFTFRRIEQNAKSIADL